MIIILRTNTEAMVVVLESQKLAIEKQLIEICDVKMKLDFICIDDEVDYGTADSLRFMADKITVIGIF